MTGLRSPSHSTQSILSNSSWLKYCSLFRVGSRGAQMALSMMPRSRGMQSRPLRVMTATLSQGRAQSIRVV